jgi:hypothetical protein
LLLLSWAEDIKIPRRRKKEKKRKKKKKTGKQEKQEKHVSVTALIL